MLHRIITFSLRSSILSGQKFIHKFPSDCFKISEEVSRCLSNGDPVVALESTVITHGLPYPDNMRCAQRLEEIVRQEKAIPATIGLLKGVVYIGMSSKEIEILAAKKENTVKISRRDLPYVINKNLSGGTTVAATMALAYRAGIPIFVTGGIGGVHKGAETNMDISADLYELSRTPMTVISAGIKSILDIGLTLEYLETLGVCVATFGTSKEFPSFFTPKSKFLSPCNVETYEEAACLINSRDKLQLESGLLLAVPIPHKHYEDGLQTDTVIEEALHIAQDKGITGKDITPFVLKKVQELSGGAATRANIGLLENNAQVGSRIAVQLSQLKKIPAGSSSSRVLFAPVRHEAVNVISSRRQPVVIGGSILDIHMTALEDIQMDGRTLRGKIQTTAGGVGRNVADCMSRLMAKPLFLSVMGNQGYAQTLLGMMDHMNVNGIRMIKDARTATCVILLDKNGECILLIGDMDIHEKLLPEQMETYKEALSAAPLVVMDANIPTSTMSYIFKICSDYKVPVWFEPTDMALAHRPFESGSSEWRSSLSYASPNLNELRVMHEAILGKKTQPVASDSLEGMLEESLNLGVPLLSEALHTLVVTLGAHGVLLITNLSSSSVFPTAQRIYGKCKIRSVHYPAPVTSKVVSVSGAGDCFAAGMIAAILRGLEPDACVDAGQRAAFLCLASHHSVPNSIHPTTVFHPDAHSWTKAKSVILT